MSSDESNVADTLGAVWVEEVARLDVDGVVQDPPAWTAMSTCSA
jgi:hypothetical protein